MVHYENLDFYSIVDLYIGFSFIQSQGQPMTDNPFFHEYTAPFQTPPLDKIKHEHYIPAFKKGIKDQQREIEFIVKNTQPATFYNTIESLDQTGDFLSRVSEYKRRNTANCHRSNMNDSVVRNRLLNHL
jgi:peptidyl-dipeptidase Dcp